MFTNQQIQSLNDLEFEVYNYISTHLEQIPKMKIRDLADAVHVSTSTILRFCTKVDCEGYSELKLKVKMFLDKEKSPLMKEDFSAITSFLEYVETDIFQNAMNKAVDVILEHDNIMFFGNSQSGILGKYGARYFSNLGAYANYIEDPFYPMPPGTIKDSVLVALSVSGETQETLKQVKFYKNEHASIVAITTSPESTIAKLADASICYYFPVEYINGDNVITCQVPVILILELLAKKVHNRKVEMEKK